MEARKQAIEDDIAGISAPYLLSCLKEESLINFHNTKGEKVLLYQLSPREVEHPSELANGIRGSSMGQLNTDRIPSVKPAVLLPGVKCPEFYLLADLPKDGASLLCQARVITHFPWAFRIIPFDAPIPAYVMTLDGITAHPCENGDVAEGIAQAAILSPEVKNFLIRLCPQNTSFDEYRTQIFRSLRVVPVEVGTPGRSAGPGKPGMRLVWKVYINPPSNNIDRHNEWLAILNRIKLNTLLANKLTRHEFKPCSYCRGTDHPIGFCPYPDHPNCPDRYGALKNNSPRPPPENRQDAHRDSGRRRSPDHRRHSPDRRRHSPDRRRHSPDYRRDPDRYGGRRSSPPRSNRDRRRH